MNNTCRNLIIGTVFVFMAIGCYVFYLSANGDANRTAKVASMSLYANFSDEERFDRASVVAIGEFTNKTEPRIVDFTFAEEPKQCVARDFSFVVSETLKGSASPGDILKVRCLGGKVGKLEEIGETQNPKLNQQMLVFLCPSDYVSSNERGIYALQTGELGIYEITGDGKIHNIDWKEARSAEQFIKSLRNRSQENVTTTP